MKKILLIALVIAGLFFSGCSRVELPSPTVMKENTAGYTLPHKVKNDKAVVYLIRPESAQSVLNFNVYLDGQKDSDEMGHTNGKEYIYFYVTPGKHTIYSKGESYRSMDIDVKAGEVIFIEQEEVMGLLVANSLLHNDYDLLTGKYMVKTLSLGTVIKTQK